MYSLVSSGQTLYQTITQPLCWRLILHCCSALLQNLVGNSCLRRSADYAQKSMSTVVPWGSWTTNRGKPPPPLQIVVSIHFCLFLFSLFLSSPSAPFLNSLSSPSPLASPPSLSLLISFLSSLVKDFKFHSVNLLSEAPLVNGSSALLSPCFIRYYIFITNFSVASVTCIYSWWRTTVWNVWVFYFSISKLRYNNNISIIDSHSTTY